MSSRSIADTPNQVTVEFQDAFNGYQQDSLLTVDVDDVQLTGQVITTALMALGIPNYDQAARISQFTLDKAVDGNTYITFATSVKALGLRPGDIITVTYLKEGFERSASLRLHRAQTTGSRLSRRRSNRTNGTRIQTDRFREAPALPASPIPSSMYPVRCSATQSIPTAIRSTR